MLFHILCCLILVIKLTSWRFIEFAAIDTSHRISHTNHQSGTIIVTAFSAPLWHIQTSLSAPGTLEFCIYQEIKLWIMLFIMESENNRLEEWHIRGTYRTSKFHYIRCGIVKQLSSGTRSFIAEVQIWLFSSHLFRHRRKCGLWAYCGQKHIFNWILSLVWKRQFKYSDNGRNNREVKCSFTLLLRIANWGNQEIGS